MNPRVCILTDSTAQFSLPDFPGHELVTVLPLQVMLRGQSFTDGNDLRLAQLPASATNGLAPRVLPPSLGVFREALLTLGQNYHDIIILLLSAHLNPAIQQAQAAVASVSVSANIHIVDSQTTSVGLGLLVQEAAEAAFNGQAAAEIKYRLRVLIPHVYTIFCVQSLSYLAHSGKLDHAQALVGEMLGLIPFLTIENGRLTPLQKARSTRHLVDTFQEFIAEFTQLNHISLLQGMPSLTQEIRYLRERVLENFPTTPYSEHILGGALATILGPRSLGLVAMEKLNGREL